MASPLLLFLRKDKRKEMKESTEGEKRGRERGRKMEERIGGRKMRGIRERNEREERKVKEK